MRFKKGDEVRYIGHWVKGSNRTKRHRPDNGSYPQLGVVGEVMELCPFGGETPVWRIKWPKGAIRSAKGVSDIFEYALELAEGAEEEPPCNPTWEELTGFGEVV